MDRCFGNVLQYCKYYLDEYKLVLEQNYKEILDEVKNKKIINKTFKLYNLSEIIPCCFMYDYGTWIFFTSLVKPKCVIKYGDSAYSKDWGKIYFDEYRKRLILKELNINDKDIIDSVVVEGCKFLDESGRDDIRGNAIEHARSKVRLEISLYMNTVRRVKFNLKNILAFKLPNKSIILTSVIVIVFMISFFLGNLEKFKYAKRIGLFGIEIEISDKYFEKESLSGNPNLLLKQLNSSQISLLKEVWKYQKANNLIKVIITKDGFIFDEANNKNTPISVSVSVLGNFADQTRFEELIISMPEYFLKRLPSTRFGDPYVLTVTEEARKLLDKYL